MAKPEAVVRVAFQLRTARASLCLYAAMNEDTIIANAPYILGHPSDTRPGRITPLSSKGHDLLPSVARPRLREPTSRVVVAVGSQNLATNAGRSEASLHSTT